MARKKSLLGNNEKMTKTYLLPKDVVRALEVYVFKHKAEKASYSDVVRAALEDMLKDELAEVREGKWGEF